MNREISLKKFIYHFCDKQRAEKKFCFVLGAGASKASGIPTGAEMAKEWMDYLKQVDKEDLETWLEKEGIREDQFAAYYPKIFDKRFELSRKDGFAYLEEAMKNAEPSCGYSVLAQILAEGKHNIVITTNFDSLTEDALFIYTQKKPLVIGHAALANYININLTRPLVVKVHHDLLLSPKNTIDEVNMLDDNLAKNLKNIFEAYTPLVVGYGGNDGSLMKLLSDLEHIEEGIYWFYLNENDINPEVVQLVERVKGHFVKIRGFDDLMIRLSEQLAYERLDGKVVEIAQKRGESYRKQIERLKQNETTECETKSAVNNIVARGKKDWWYYALLADGEKDGEKADAIYREGLKEFPGSFELCDEYANFLCDVKKDAVEAEKYYLKALELDGNYIIANSNYAGFLCEIKKDYAAAEKYYMKSLELDGNNAIAHANYANFLCYAKKDYAEAEKHYLKSLELDGSSSDVNEDYANFLCDVRKDNTRAGKHFKKSLELDQTDANKNGNYAKYLLVTGKLPEALEYIHRAFEYNGQKDDVLSLELWFYCYAVFPEQFPESKQKVERLLAMGVRSTGWELGAVLNLAARHGHPDMGGLKRFARQISEESGEK